MKGLCKFVFFQISFWVRYRRNVIRGSYIVKILSVSYKSFSNKDQSDVQTDF